MKIIFCLFILLAFVSCKKASRGGGGETPTVIDGGGLCSINGGANCPTPNPVDETPFSAGYIDPQPGSTDFGADESILIQFNRAVDLPSLIYNSGSPSMDNLILRDENGEEVQLQISVQDDLLKVKPMFSLTPGRRYTFTMRPTVRDTLGNNADSEKTTNFTVAKQAGSNPGTNTVFSWSNESNVKDNINVDRFELHYGPTMRTGNDFKYQRVAEIPISQATFDQSTGKYNHEFKDTLEDNRMYYFTLKACNAAGCSPYSEEISRFQQAGN